MKSQKYIRIVITIILFVLLGITTWYFISTLRADYLNGDLRLIYNRQAGTSPLSHNHPMMNVDRIRPWMTFDYLNVVFRLPPSYLKNILAITDVRYPNLRIDAYAKKSNTDISSLLQTIKTSINLYKAQ
jgi:hypothetical protein